MSGMAMVVGLGAWFGLRAPPAIVPHPAPSRANSDVLVEASDVSATGAPSVVSNSSSKKAGRPSMLGPRGLIITHGKPLEQVHIQYWAESYGFEITDEELVRAQEAYTAVLKARRSLEDGLVKVERIEPSRFKVVIPAYPEAGKKLLEQFRHSLAAVLGSDRAEQFMDKIKLAMTRENFGWGMADQVLDVTRRREGPVEVCEIHHGFALPASGIVSNLAGVSASTLTGVSVSTLLPQDLDIYSHLGHHFPKVAKE